MIVGNSFDVCWQNQVELQSGLTISSSSEVVTLPWTNIENQFVSKKGRTDSQTGLTLTFDFGVAVGVNRTILLGHNLTSVAGVTIEGADDSGFSSNLFSAGVTVVVANPLVSSFSQISRQYWRWVISDPGNTDGYIEAAHAFIGTRDQFELFDFVLDIEVFDPTIQSIAIGGAINSYILDQYRRVTVPMGAFQQTNRRLLQDIFSERGIAKSMYLLTDPNNIRDTEGEQRETIFGVLQGPIRTRHLQSDWHQSQELVFRELKD